VDPERFDDGAKRHPPQSPPFSRCAGPDPGLSAVCGAVRRDRSDRRPVAGSDAPARKQSEAPHPGTGGVIVGPERKPFAVAGSKVAHDRIVAIDLIIDPAKLDSIMLER
jgi:hypothetical protein